MELLLSLFKAMSVFLVLFHLYARSPAFRPAHTDWARPKARFSLYLFFSAISILGTYLGLPMAGGAIANTRAVGAVLGGMLGGPALGAAVAITSGLHRVSLGGFTALSGAVATLLEGLLAGAVHVHFMNRRQPDRLLDWKLACQVTALGEVLHMVLLVVISRPIADVLELEKAIALPMIAANSLGAALFMTVLRDRYNLFDKVAAAGAANALRIAERTLGPAANGFGPEVAAEMAGIIREETGVGAVAITDTERVLAFVGAGSDHHRAGTRISSPLTRQAIDAGDVVFADGESERYTCAISGSCPLGSVVVVPLEVEGTVVGTVQLFEPAQKPFRRTNKSLVEGIGDLLSKQLLVHRLQEQKNLLVTAELRLVRAQVNPHFLFNALNTIVAVTRTDPERARHLLAQLSAWFRNNLKRRSETSTLAEELEHVAAYLEIEKARFQDRLVVEIDVDPALLGLEVPTFTLQPLVENAVKHGLAHSLDRGVARIRVRAVDGVAIIEVEDNGGAFVPRDGPGDGLGMNIVDKRIKNLLGPDYGLTVACVPNELTRVTVRVPLPGRAA